ncbi:hypothetical protein FRC98_03510 [Lujinxingia vulgaris]|uniref:Uncharacterized protein n=1 Tax=Lujinxingia vulgaris TaxID=2600176 RepID=A0A5C6XC40_9DELT|nr:hypothetical protein [Lujinxingia vulgaris]TXD39476.1 hypothetical protein FRC98_03510 [Lujinxingia vulgaris]
MEIRCDVCKEVGPASEVRAADQGMELVCASCGHANVLKVGGTTDASADAQSRDGDASPHAGPIARAASRSDAEQGVAPQKRSVATPGASLAEGVVEAAMARLIPVSGAGPRCPKCAHLVAGADHCERCGLSQSEANRYAPGHAPWEQAPPGKDDAFLRLNAAWARAEDGDPEAMRYVAELAISEGLVEAGISRLRFYLVERPDDPHALDALRRLAIALQARVTVAAGQAAASAENFGKDVRRLRGLLMTITLGLCALILLLLSAVFWDKC